MRTLQPTIAAVAAAVLISGCGTSDDRAQSRATVERFLAAFRHHDGRGACAELSSDTVKALVQQEGRPCAQAVTGLKISGGRVLRVRVYITNAVVDLAGGESEFLGRGTSGWELSAVGCKPQGKPRDRPFDCQAED